MNNPDASPPDEQTSATTADDANVEQDSSPPEGDQPQSSQATAAASASQQKSPRANFQLIILSLTVLSVMAINGIFTLFMVPQTPPPPLPSVADIVAAQVTAIRAEETDTLELSDLPISDAELDPLQGLPGLEVLILDAGVVTDAGLQTIASLPDLIHLRIRQSEITDEGLKAIKHSENLRVLNLPQAKLTSQGINHLADLSKLRQLRVGGDGTNDISRSVAKLKQLRAVHLINVPVSDEGLKDLAKMPYLESLYLDNPRITSAGWDWLFANHPELHIHVNQTHHDRDPNWHSHRPNDE